MSEEKKSPTSVLDLPVLKRKHSEFDYGFSEEETSAIESLTSIRDEEESQIMTQNVIDLILEEEIPENQLDDRNFDLMNNLMHSCPGDTIDPEDMVCTQFTFPELHAIINEEGNRYLKHERSRHLVLPVHIDATNDLFHCFLYDFKTDKFIMSKCERAVIETILGENL